MKTIVVLPTYNERENIAKALDSILAETDVDVLVVDGNSPDGTGDIVLEYKRDNPGVELLKEEKKSGLGGAYILGMNYAIKELGADVVVEMDADLQHSPKDLKRLLAEIENGADCAIGTRFMKGGSIPKSWALHRKFLSYFGNLYLRVIAGMWKHHDVTSGFRATRVKGILDKIDLNTLRSKDFAYKIDLYHKISFLGAKIVEVPINFLDRGEGDSKQTSGKNILDSLKVATLISLERYKTFLKVGVVGFSGVFVNFAFLLLFVEVFELDKVLSNILSAEISIISNFMLNSIWTFRSHKSKDGLIVRAFKFNIGSVGAIFIQGGLQYLGIKMFGEAYYLAYAFVGIMIGWLWNYFFYSRLVWQKK